MSNDVTIESVLSQIRAISAQINSSSTASVAGNQSTVDFGAILKKSIDAVNDVQKTSDELKTKFELGDPSINLVDVMVASEKAKIAFTAMSEVRKKLVQAYQDVMSMPI